VGPRAIDLRYVVSTRDARFAGLRDRHQSVQTVTLSYDFVGRGRFGAVEWR
jgi:hypothetical protein